MKIWVIITGEPMPFVPTEASDRFLRAGLLSKRLVALGHDVTLWTAQFYHQKKMFRDVPVEKPVDFGPDAPSMIFLKSSGYDGNVSVKRLWDHLQLGRGFKRLAPKQPRPDIIFCAYPTVELAAQAVRYGQKFDVPVVLDIRDLWPDVIYERLEAKIGFQPRGLLLPYERMAKRAFGLADGVVGLTKGMLEWGQTRFSRPEAKRKNDASFFQFKHSVNIDHYPRDEAAARLKAIGVDIDQPKIRFVWVGNIVPDTDAKTLLTALENLPPELAAKVEFIICGRGSLAARIEEMTQRLPHVTYINWVVEPDLSLLLRYAHVGLLCYLDRPDFQMSIPNKVVDYCAGGMQILTNLTQEIGKLPEASTYIHSYKTGDAEDLVSQITNLTNASTPEFSPQSRAAFDALFNADKVVHNMENYLTKIFQDHRDKAAKN